MSNQHTPGPWRVSPAPGYPGAQRQSLSVVTDRGLLARVTQQPGTHRAEAEANTRLLAASPQMLEALQLSLRNIESLIYVLPVSAPATDLKSLEAWASKARAAIQAATGGKA